MKQLTIRTILAALAAFAASGAQAQTLNANVPFPFYMNGVAMPAGPYQMQVDRAPYKVVLRNPEAKKQAVSFVDLEDVPKKVLVSGKPVMMFECTGSQCVLFQVWQGGLSQGLRLSTPKLKIDRDMRTVVTTIKMIHAD